MELAEKYNFNCSDANKAIALMIYADIDLDEDNPMLNEIIEHIEDDGDNVYTLYLYNKDFDYWEENIVKTILSSQEVDSDVKYLKQEYIDSVSESIPEYLKPWFDFERYAEDMVEENIYDMDDDYEWIYVNGANYLVATIYR
jgi:hypothetical protein